MLNYIYIKNKRYVHYDSYPTYKQALKIAQWKKKKNGSKYFILQTETKLFSKKKYILYLTKIYKIGL